jgi:hypothetical protein
MRSVPIRDKKTGRIITNWPSPERFKCIVCGKSPSDHKESCGKFGGK